MDIKVKIDNEEVLFEYIDGDTLKEDQKPYMPKDENGDTIYRVLVPIRYPFEQLGFDVNWEDRDSSNGYKGKAIASNNKGNVLSDKSKIKSKLYDVSIKEGNAFCETNGEEHEYIDDVVPVFTGGRTCLPMRTVFESIDCFVDWDSANNTVVVYSLENYYRIKNRDGKYLTYESTDNDTRIVVKNKDNDNPYSQVWEIERSPESHKHHIRATQNVNRGINIYHGNNTCTIYDIDGNIPDTSFTIDNALNATEVGECVISWVDGDQTLCLGERESGAIFQADNTQHWIIEPVNFPIIFTPTTNTIYKIAPLNSTSEEDGVERYLSVPSDIDNNSNVCISSSSSNMHWKIVDENNRNIKIVLKNNTSYGLNYYWSDGEGEPGNCDIYPHSNNKDSIVKFINNTHEPQLPIGRIKLVRDDVELFLTVDGTSYEGSNVSWQPYEESYNQMWKFIEVFENNTENESESDGDTETEDNESGERTIIDLPSDRTCNWNQYYAGVVNKIGSTAGCSWTCALNVANIYGPDSYEPSDMPDSAWDSEDGCMWYLPNNCIGKIDGYTSYTSDSDMLSLIRSEIQNNRPVIVELYKAGEAYPQHFVVAYGYKNDGTAKSDILVFDPGVGGDDDPPPKKGLQHTLTEAEEHNYNKLMRRIRKTTGR